MPAPFFPVITSWARRRVDTAMMSGMDLPKSSFPGPTKSISPEKVLKGITEDGSLRPGVRVFAIAAKAEEEAPRTEGTGVWPGRLSFMSRLSLLLAVVSTKFTETVMMDMARLRPSSEIIPCSTPDNTLRESWTSQWTYDKYWKMVYLRV